MLGWWSPPMIRNESPSWGHQPAPPIDGAADLAVLAGWTRTSHERPPSWCWTGGASGRVVLPLTCLVSRPARPRLPLSLGAYITPAVLGTVGRRISLDIGLQFSTSIGAMGARSRLSCWRPRRSPCWSSDGSSICLMCSARGRSTGRWRRAILVVSVAAVVAAHSFHPRRDPMPPRPP